MISKNEFSKSLAERMEASAAGSAYPIWEEERMWVKVNEKMNPPQDSERTWAWLTLVLVLLATGFTADATAFKKNATSLPDKKLLQQAPMATAPDKVQLMVLAPVAKHKLDKHGKTQIPIPPKTTNKPLPINTFGQQLPVISTPDSNTMILAVLWDQSIYTDIDQDWASIDAHWRKEQSFDLLRPTKDSTYFPHPEIKLKITND